MLSRSDNELITNTDRGTSMGEVFRRFWLPVLLSSELPGPDSTPLRVKLLNEDVIAFRDTDGRVGLVDAYCPHRGAPMFFGRNEENGLRCVYHGWKFDVDGVCVDLPNAPEGETFRHKVRIRSYPCLEAGDLVWAYMGPAGLKPPFPEFEWTHLPSAHRYVTKFRLECNYLQAMEGDYDPSHGGFLHTTLTDKRIVNPSDTGQTMLNFASNATRSEGPIVDHEAGAFLSFALPRGDGSFTAMSGPWMMPIFCTAGLAGPNTYSSNMRVPIDNESLMFYRLRWSYSPIPEAEMDEYRHGEYTYPKVIPGTWKTEANVANDYKIDRVAQKYFTFSGIKTFPLQDIAMMENQWGPLADRTQEHLTSQDNQIIYVRRRLLKAAKALASGIEPSEPWHPEGYRYHSEMVVGPGVDEAVRQAIAKSGERRAAVQAPRITV